MAAYRSRVVLQLISTSTTRTCSTNTRRTVFRDVAQDLVDDSGHRLGRVNTDRARRQVLTCLVDSQHKLSFLGPVAELVGGSDVQPPMERLDVHFEDEDFVEQLDEHRRVPRTAAEERRRTTLIGSEHPHLVDIPDVVLVAFLERPAAERFVEKEAARAVTMAGENSVAMHDVVAASFEFLGHRGLPSGRHAVDEVVALTHARDGRATPLRPPPRAAALELLAAASNLVEGSTNGDPGACWTDA